MGELAQAVKERNLQVIDAEVVEDNVINLPALGELGFDKAVKKIDRVRKLKVAYAKYGYVTQEAIDVFNRKLHVETLEEDKNTSRYKCLVFFSPKDYGEVPPWYVLDKMKDAMADNIFDSFEIAKIDWRVEQKDPILFGRIEGCSDRFFISQWDDDVKVEDIVLAGMEE